MNEPLYVAMTVEQCWQPVPGGSGTYIVELSRELARRDDVSVRGLAARHTAPAPADWTPNCPTTMSRLPRVALYRAWNRLGAPRAERTLGATPDLVHATTWALPPTRRPSVVNIHDLAFRRHPEHFTSRGVRFFERALTRVTAEATLVLVPSHATADDCTEAGIEVDRLRVIPLGVRTLSPSDAAAAGPPQHGALPERYLLWCGTQEPRKNLARLLRAFALVAADEPDLHLVLVGPVGWKDSGIRTDVGPFTDRVHVLGQLAWADLQRVYAGAAAFCFPSIWEGFGLPVVEAMAYGLPVVTSAGSPMAESLDGAGLLVDPLDEHSIAVGMARSVGPEHDSLSGSSRERARTFTWEHTAELTVAAYREAVAT